MSRWKEYFIALEVLFGKEVSKEAAKATSLEVNSMILLGLLVSLFCLESPGLVHFILTVAHPSGI